MKENKKKYKKITAEILASIIQREVSWFNGWKTSEERERESCLRAARKIKRLLDN